MINPHFAAAFVGRDCGRTGPDRLRRFDLFYTHERDSVITAGRAYLQHVKARRQLYPPSSHSDALNADRHTRCSRWQATSATPGDRLAPTRSVLAGMRPEASSTPMKADCGPCWVTRTTLPRLR